MHILEALSLGFLFIFILKCKSVFSHTINLVRFDVVHNRTVNTAIDIALDVNANEVAVEACYNLYFDASKEEINQCIAMATPTIRDHTLAVANEAILRLLGESIKRDKANEVTIMALQYALEDLTLDDDDRYSRVCYIGLPGLLDSLYILLSGVDELLILENAKENDTKNILRHKKDLEKLAFFLNKKVIVLHGHPVETLQKLNSMQHGEGRLCQAVVIKTNQKPNYSEYIDEIFETISSLEQNLSVSAEGSDGEATVSVPSASNIRVVVVRDFSLEDRLLSFPSVSIDGRHFIAHNTTQDMFHAPECHSNVNWLLGSVWLNGSNMYAMSNVDGMTGRSFSSASYLSANESTTGIMFMQELWVGELINPISTRTATRTIAESNYATDDNNRYGNMNIVIAISYTIRVFGETAVGLKRALRSLGYKKVYIVPDMNIATLKHLQDEANQLLLSLRTEKTDAEAGGIVLQIALGPHDFAMLAPFYIVFQMEQVWSTIAFGGLYKLRYGLVLSNAQCILTYSSLHSQLLRNLGYPCVHEVPLYSHSTLLSQTSTLDEVAADFTTQSAYHSDTTAVAAIVDDDVHNVSGANVGTGTGTCTGTCGVGVDAAEGSISSSSTLFYKTYDFSFYGGCSERRSRELTKLEQAFPLCNNENDMSTSTCYRYALNCVGWDNGVFDSLRFLQVQRSHLLVNIHTDEQSVLEAHRLNYLLSQGACVVSETSDDALLDERFSAAVVFVPAGDQNALHNAIRTLLSNATAMDQCRRASIRLYRRMSADTRQLNIAIQEAVKKF